MKPYRSKLEKDKDLIELILRYAIEEKDFKEYLNIIEEFEETNEVYTLLESVIYKIRKKLLKNKIL